MFAGLLKIKVFYREKKKISSFYAENFNPKENFHTNVCIGLKAEVFLPLFSRNISKENISICFLTSLSHLCKPNSIPLK